MEKFIIQGGKKLQGTVKVMGAKNVALKVLVASCLTDEKVTIHNVPHLLDVQVMLEIIKDFGGEIEQQGHTVTVQMKRFAKHDISLELGAKARTSNMFIAPLLLRVGEAIIPNPGGCRLGARPIDRTIEGLKHMGADITYHSDDGYFYAKTDGLKSTNYTFEKNTHTGTETMILAAVLAQGTTVLKNAAEEPEIDELIELLNLMGGNVSRTGKREITIQGARTNNHSSLLHGAEFTIGPDRNEIVAFAVAAIATQGNVFVEGAKKHGLVEFLQKLDEVGAGYEIQVKAQNSKVKSDGIRFYYKAELKAASVTTEVYPGFMTDWQAPWAVLMTQAGGTSVLHETVFENKFGYVKELRKMGAQIKKFNPSVENPEQVYNFNLADDSSDFYHAIKIIGPKQLHNAIVTMHDIRAGEAVVIAALAAKGWTTIFGVEKLDRGHEKFEERLNSLGAKITRVTHEISL